jgi:hypothetical protein
MKDFDKKLDRVINASLGIKASEQNALDLYWDGQGGSMYALDRYSRDIEPILFAAIEEGHFEDYPYKYGEIEFLAREFGSKLMQKTHGLQDTPYDDLTYNQMNSSLIQGLIDSVDKYLLPAMKKYTQKYGGLTKQQVIEIAAVYCWQQLPKQSGAGDDIIESAYIAGLRHGLLDFIEYADPKLSH